MAAHGTESLDDPAQDRWDPLFNTANKAAIHGVLKVAGSDQEIINAKLDTIKGILGYPKTINDVEGESLPTTNKSRVDGHLRPRPFKGHEQ